MQKKTGHAKAPLGRHLRKNWTNYLFLMPAVLFIGVFFFTSIVYTVWLSTTKSDGFSPPEFVGLANYAALFQDANFRVSVANTVIWVVCSFVIQVLLPLLLAILCNKSSRPGVFKNFFYFPNAISQTIGGLIIASMLSVYGLPQLFKLVGMDHLVRDWLAIPQVNTFIMIGASAWQGIGLNLILFIVGLNNIDTSPVEAATIEGAGVVKMYTKVIFPLLSNTFKVVFLQALVNSFKIFDSIWVMTKGGPYRSSETLALTMYIETFVRNNIGLGSAVAVVLSVVVLFISYFNLRGTFRDDN